MIDTFTLTRRTFACTTLVAGFTLATGPLHAAAIVTAADGLDAGEVSIAVAGGKIPGYRARPKKDGHRPVVLVVQEIFGVHEHIRDLCRRLAHAGYYAIAPSLYARYGDPGKYDLEHAKDLMTDIVSKVPDSEVMSDLDSTVAFAKSEFADTTKLAITGFCWGGRIVWLYAAHNPDLDAGAAWYGQLKGPVPANPLRPKSPLDLVGALKAPVTGFYGGLDKGISQDDVAAMNAALAAAGKADSHIEVFPDAQHGFNADYRPSYNAADAKTAWAQMLAFFKAHGVG